MAGVPAAQAVAAAVQDASRLLAVQLLRHGACESLVQASVLLWKSCVRV